MSDLPATNQPPYRVFGIRHHGPGSAASVVAALEDYAPDALLIEGPPEADALIALAASAEMVPPVALLVYVADEPAKAAFYPFAEFSPEWQALRYALGRAIPAHFFDLPQAHMLALRDAPREDPDDPAVEETDAWSDLARAAGAPDPETLWDRLIEARRDTGARFAAVTELMGALREAQPTVRFDLIREAWMRRELRAALKAGHARIAVVCGAWHAPALAELPSAKADQELLRGLPKIPKVASTWVPWTNGRLTLASGYGAGIASPGWYEHLWRQPPAGVAAWMSQAAQLFRAHDLEVSPAHAIEATRLAEMLAVLRGRAEPGLAEVVDAIQTIYCNGDATPLQLVAQHLIVGERLGAVPAGTPEPPLVADLRREQKRLRLPPEAGAKTLALDLRKDIDRERSQLLHRLLILGLPWGSPDRHARGTGTFRETWELAWQPEFAITLIEAGRLGNRVELAALNRATARAARATSLPELAGLFNLALKAGLDAAVDGLIGRLDDVAALSADGAELMRTLAMLAPLARYGDVRRTDASSLDRIIQHLVERTTIGLPQTCAVNDDAAPALAQALAAADQALHLLAAGDLDLLWCGALLRTSDSAATHPLIAGRAVRILLDRQALATEDVERRLALALSPGVAAEEAAWLEGFLAGSGLLLLHRPELLAMLDGWLAALESGHFEAILPLLRRAFALFEPVERRQIGEVLTAGGAAGPGAMAAGGDIDWQRAAPVLPLIARYFGVEAPN